MSVTIDLSPDVEKWLSDKVQSGAVASAEDYIAAALQRDFMEEQIEESLREPAAPLTEEDWANVRREVSARSSAHSR